jgi:3-oxoacyl-[acyl-carrier-protein] synthase II
MGGAVNRRVVVTGMGVISPLGNNLDATWQGLIEGRSGIGYITAFDTSNFPVRIAGEVKGFDPLDYLDRKTARRMDPFQHYAFAAATEALHQANLEITPANAARVGVLIGSGIGGIQVLSAQYQVLYERGPDRISPFLITQMVIDLAPGQVSILLGAKGPNFSTVSACATGATAIGEATEIIRRGQADVMIAGGSEAAIVPIGLAGFCSMHALSTRNDDPERASRPFDAARDGFVMSEGAGILVLEAYDHARARGVPMLAEIVGYGSTGDANHITDPAPGGEGAARAMAMALQQARLQPCEIDYLNAHGTSTVANDRAETAAIKTAFGEAAYKLPISSTKSMTGHMMGAAGAAEAIFAIQTIRTGCIPPTINYEQPDPECDLDYVPNRARRAEVRTAMSNAFGFGGHNASLIFRAIE